MGAGQVKAMKAVAAACQESIDAMLEPVIRSRKIGSTATGVGVARPTTSPLSRAFSLIPWVALPFVGWPGVAHAQTSPGATPVTEAQRVEIIGVAPLPGRGVDRDLLPYSTQSIKRGAIEAANADTLSDFMARRLPGVQVNDIQGSPFQGDLTYRGFRASPLLGAGQGLSVFLDGVRINEPFGDVVNFDLIPEFSVNSISLVPGANPAFGLNSLGGALSYTTHDGRSAPGVRAEVSIGSFGRKRVDFSVGRRSDSGWHGYLGGTAFDEDGWRDHSKGKLGNLLGKLGHDNGTTSWNAGLLVARSRLIGNGLVPAYTLDDGKREPDLYAARRAAVYTHPDETRNRLEQLSFNFQHEVDANSTLSALAYARRTQRDTVNGDAADQATPESNAAFNTTATRQTGQGAALSFARRQGGHQWQVGASLDRSRTHYRQLEREGNFTADRGVVPLEGEPAELSANVEGRSQAWGLYVTDTIQLGPRTHLTAAARYNIARVTNQLTTRDDVTGELEDEPRESFLYTSFNPAIGLAHKLDGGPTLFANIARNTRVPTVIELGCADPQQPCRLPAGLQSDPYLKQIVSTTVEAGVRWQPSAQQRFSVAAYRTSNKNDILFRSVSVAGQLGYFANFARTRNQGADVEYALGIGSLQFTLGYSFLDATYQAEGVLRQGERNVTIAPGTRIAGLPRHTLKLSTDWRAANGLTLGADLQALSRRVSSGNEDGLIADGEAGEAPQRADLSVPGYAIFNLRASFKPTPDWEFYVKLNNAFDRRLQTFGALAETVFSATGGYTGNDRDALFVAPGTPRSVFVGVRLRY